MKTYFSHSHFQDQKFVFSLQGSKNTTFLRLAVGKALSKKGEITTLVHKSTQDFKEWKSTGISRSKSRVQIKPTKE